MHVLGQHKGCWYTAQYCETLVCSQTYICIPYILVARNTKYVFDIMADVRLRVVSAWSCIVLQAILHYSLSHE